MKRLACASMLTCLTCLAITTGPARAAGEIGFVEDYVLAADKEAAIAKLVPGTEEHFFYRCLHLQATGRLDAVDGVLKDWLARTKGRHTTLMSQVENRQALLKYRQDPAGSLSYIARKLGLRFDHQRRLATRSKLSSRLDPAAISRQALARRAFAHDSRLGGFERSAVEWLIRQDLDPARRRALLGMLTRPDYDGLVELIAADLKSRDSRGFGSIPIHKRLLRTQLDALRKAVPALERNSTFVNVYLARLRPGSDVDLRHDPAAQLAYLDRILAFVRPLAPAFNSLKAHVLYHRLALDLKRGRFDAALFLEYLKLPRRSPQVRPEYLQLKAHRGVEATLTANFAPATGLGPVGNDEPLIRQYLEHFLLDAEDYDAYSPYLRDTYLKRVFAETKLLGGVGEGARWTAMLSPAEYKALAERVDLDFAATNPTYFAPDRKVALDVLVKNVEKLIVKVYRIDAAKYARQNGRAVPFDLDLDGLVANEQKTYTYDAPPIRRVRRRFEFPQLSGRGVFIIELIGSGKRSRAMVRKGRLGYVVRTTPAGQEFTVLDEAGRKLPDAKLWLAGHLYEADADGTITVPFTHKPGPQKIVLLHGPAATPETFDHLAEKYELTCGFFVDREALLRRKTARLLVRPQLRLAGVPISLSLLKEVTLTVTSTDRDGVATTQRVENFALHEDRESTFDFRVPERLAKITFRLEAKVRNLSRARDDALAAGRTFALNGIDATGLIEDIHLLRTAGGFVLEMRGRNGEPVPDRPVNVILKHRDFRQNVTVSLKTDAAGRIELGALKDIDWFETRHGPNMSVVHRWSPSADLHDLPRVLHGRAGATLSIPWMEPDRTPQREALSLLEVRGGQFVADRFDALAVADGMLQLRGLPAGDYSLLLKRTGWEIAVKVTAGPPTAGYLTSPYRRLEVRDARPVQIVSVAPGKEALRIRLANATKFTRVHVVACRYEPEYPLFASLHPFGWLAPQEATAAPPASLYLAGRRISDEYRYILDRRYAPRHPGNMLKRPSLLLNPFSPRKTDTGRAHGGEGQALTPPAEKAGGGRAGKYYGAAEAPPRAGGFSNLDFLADGAVLAANLRPDADGVVTVPRETLAGRQHVRILAVDPEHTAFRQVALAEAPARLRDLRLGAARALDAARHFIQQKKVTAVAQGGTLKLRDVTAARFETFDTLAKVYRLYLTLDGSSELREFAFLVDWPKLSEQQKREKYSKYACHELHFFLARRDPAFFEKVVLPYLKNKKDKTFLDRWLCGEDVGEYLQPWRHGRLNVFEQILLARRVAGEGPATARHVRELHELIPPDVDRFNRLFDTAVGLSRLRPPAPGGTTAAIIEAESLDADKIRDLAERVRSSEMKKAADAKGALRSRLMREAPAAAAAPPAPPAAKPRAARPMDSVPRGGVAGYFAAGAKRKAVRQLYRPVGQVREWIENNYYHLPDDQAGPGLVSVNAFWRDYAAWDGRGAFLSPNFAEASRNFHEILLALAVLDVPFETPKHKVALDGGAMSITFGDEAVVFHEEISEAPAVPKVRPILVSQNYYPLAERYRHVGGEKVDNFIADEFLRGVAYGCHVVVTNPTSTRRKLHVLTQLPRGAMPLAGGRYTQTRYVVLEPYRTQTFDFAFYFPAEGAFAHYPVHVARRGELVAFAAPTSLRVVAEPTKIDRESWEFVSQNGTNAQVLAYLDGHNIRRLDLDLIAWRMKEKAFFRAVIERLARRHVYHGTLWSYGLLHDDPAAVREYLQHADAFVSACGGPIDTPLLTIDPVLRKWYRHVEYWPLVNARAHAFGGRRKILVQRFHGQYHALLNILRYRAELTDEDRLALTCYLLLQDRVAEAQKMFAAVHPDNLPERIQYDYFAAYLDFFNEPPTRARAIAARYADYPVKRWRDLFAAVTAQLDEIETGRPKVIDEKDRDETQTQLAATEPTFDLAVEGGQVILSCRNLTTARVNYYLMDIELMFSRQPFVRDRGGQFAYIQPNATSELKIPAGAKRVTLELPGSLRNRNVMVEVVAGGKTRTQAYYSHSLLVQLMENYGQLRVTHRKTGRPLAKVYVKVYARMKDGRVEFYKDGYTDLRGRFDYTSLNTDQLAAVEKFAVLVLSESDGSTVREALPPKR